MRSIITFSLLLCLVSCNNSDRPDISAIKADLVTQRFERDFFSLDTTQLLNGIQQLNSKYPSFADNFLTTILNTDPRWSPDTTRLYVQGFISAYRDVFDTSQNVFPDFTKYEQQIEKAARYTKFYFPEYKIPEKIITYIGPLNGYGDILSEDAFIVGLHLHLGKEFTLYKTMHVVETYPEYISKRFEPEYIQINCMVNIINDMFPEKFDDKSLVVQMVEKGKRLYTLQKLLPDVDEYKLIGYTKKQLDESYQHEKIIWNLFVQNNFLRTLDHNIIKNYIGESPKTMELGEASPGNIGSFAGWQIVKKYMGTNNDVTLQQLMAKDADEIFQQAKYKP